MTNSQRYQDLIHIFLIISRAKTCKSLFIDTPIKNNLFKNRIWQTSQAFLTGQKLSYSTVVNLKYQLASGDSLELELIVGVITSLKQATTHEVVATELTILQPRNNVTPTLSGLLGVALEGCLLTDLQFYKVYFYRFLVENGDCNARYGQESD